MSRRDMQSREQSGTASAISRFSQLTREYRVAEEPVALADHVAGRMSSEERGRLAQLARAEQDRQKIRRERALLDEADRLAATLLTGREPSEEVQRRNEILTRARLLRVQTPRLSDREMERLKIGNPEGHGGGQEIRGKIPVATPPTPSREEAEWAGEQNAAIEIIPEQTLPVTEIIEGLQAKPIEGPYQRPLEAHINRPVRSGDFLEFHFTDAPRVRLKVVDRVGSLPDTVLYATPLHESQDENQFAEEVMRLQRAAPSRTARLAMKKRPQVWQMDVGTDGSVSLAALRNQQEVIEEAKILQGQVEEHKRQLAEHEGETKALTKSLFAKVPAASEGTG